MDTAKFFEENGYAVVEDVFTEEEVADMKKEITRYVNQLEFDQLPRSVFSTYDEKKHAKDEYFVESGSKISSFFEEGALDENFQLKVNKDVALNKIGHALHWLNPIFKKYTFSDKIKAIMRTLGFEEPEVVQSMYIFKQPRIGGSVNEHIDATFLRANPIQNLVGLWIAIDDAAEDNGCLEFAPKSHKTSSAEYRFVRTGAQDGPIVEFRGPKPAYDKLKFVPVPVKKGSLVIIHGLTVHRSQANTSESSRHAYTLHILERKGAEWEKDNWLQPTATYSFPNLYAN